MSFATDTETNPSKETQNANMNQTDNSADEPPKKRQRLNQGACEKQVSQLQGLDDDVDDIDVTNTTNDKNHDEKKSDNLKSNNCNTHSNVNGNSIIRLNVGGEKYVTTRSTLLNFNDQGHSMLGAMFGGNFSLQPTINGNEYFIDRNGKYFRYILDFLRNGQQFAKLVLPTLSKETIAHVKQEAAYFGLYNSMFHEFDAPIMLDTSLSINGKRSAYMDTKFSKAVGWRLGGLRVYTTVSETIPFKLIINQQKVCVIFKQEKTECTKTHDPLTFRYGIGYAEKVVELTSKDFGYYPCGDQQWKSAIENYHSYVSVTNEKLYVKITVDFEKKIFCTESSTTKGLFDNSKPISSKMFDFPGQQDPKYVRLCVLVTNHNHHSICNVNKCCIAKVSVA